MKISFFQLICVIISVIAAPLHAYRIIFWLNAATKGDLGGLVGGDARCMQAASLSNIQEVQNRAVAMKAWLSTSSANAM